MTSLNPMPLESDIQPSNIINKDHPTAVADTAVSVDTTIPTAAAITTSDSTNATEKDIIQQLKSIALKNKNQDLNCSNVQWCCITNKNLHSINSISMNLNSGVVWNNANLLISNNDGSIINTLNNSIILEHIQQCELDLYNLDFIIRITHKINFQNSFLFKFKNFNDYINVLSTLIIWHNLKQNGLEFKWNFNNSMIYNENLNPNEIIVCRFKIYGPLPDVENSNQIHINENGPENPIFPTPLDSNIKEGWFTVIGHLLPTGILNLISELDGKLLYSINITLLFDSEIRILHHSILQNSNILFLGFINQLRESHNVNIFSNSYNYFIQNENYNKITRILIDFDLRIDLEDWFVALSSFTKLEFVGNNINKLKISKELSFEIMEAQFDITNNSLLYLKEKYLYCELICWNTPWFRSAIVKNDFHLSTFWKELINVKLPISDSNDFKILIKLSSSKDNYNINGENSDEIIGTCFVNSKLFNKVHFLQKIPILNLSNNNIGNLMINLSQIETNILPFQKYKSFENILMNLKIDSVISYLEPKSNTSNLEYWSIMLLDIYQSLHKEDEYFETLMKYELSPIDSLSDSNISKENPQILSNKNSRYHTIFRGNSMLSKSLEKYTVRIGHEYLEKLLGKFIETIQIEDLNCECDPKIDPENYKENYQNLLKYLKYLWKRIYETTNDIPESIKIQWKNLRQNVELSVDLNDKETPFNALSSFIFLRFLCPAILSPKLYNLSKTHYSGKISRTLVLIAKVLMVFSNRSKFQNHKDPYLIPLNEDFLKSRRNEMMIYFDKVTFRKMDFNERLLDMSNIVDRIQLNTSKDILNELPTMPFLIDKYLNIAKLVKLISNFYQIEKNQIDNNESNEEININYQIEGFDESRLEDDFLTSLINEESDALNSLLLKHEFKLKDLKRQSLILIKQTDKYVEILNDYELPNIFSNDLLFEDFINSIIRSIRLSPEYRINFDLDLFHNDKLSEYNIENIKKFNLFLYKLNNQNERNLLKKSTLISNRSNSAINATQLNINKTSHPKIKLNSSPVNSTPIAENDSNKKKSTLFKNIFKRKSVLN
ncbi:hypothetical protein C6P40_002405 [Pichia californica]|uniref:Ras-GAP domain-containing protein n=1 Tax=Pichia californica TaxID=460514 RepID=A0A9P6WHN7_9ASCO|nr:hypothetical protein C6P42_002371 [[Candida] californica]KAG0687384.1 hypothetical protein C6P40_002405 [[Candida] californica]